MIEEGWKILQQLNTLMSMNEEENESTQLNQKLQEPSSKRKGSAAKDQQASKKSSKSRRTKSNEENGMQKSTNLGSQKKIDEIVLVRVSLDGSKNLKTELAPVVIGTVVSILMAITELSHEKGLQNAVILSQSTEALFSWIRYVSFLILKKELQILCTLQL